jgi:hypothetical protein
VRRDGKSPGQGLGCGSGIRDIDDVDDQQYEIRIVMGCRPPAGLYGRLVLGCQWMVAVLGMGRYATVRPDQALVTDAELNALRDQLDQYDPWSP